MSARESHLPRILKAHNAVLQLPLILHVPVVAVPLSELALQLLLHVHPRNPVVEAVVSQLVGVGGEEVDVPGVRALQAAVEEEGQGVGFALHVEEGHDVLERVRLLLHLGRLGDKLRACGGDEEPIPHQLPADLHALEGKALRPFPKPRLSVHKPFDIRCNGMKHQGFARKVPLVLPQHCHVVAPRELPFSPPHSVEVPSLRQVDALCPLRRSIHGVLLHGPVRESGPGKLTAESRDGGGEGGECGAEAVGGEAELLEGRVGKNFRHLLEHFVVLIARPKGSSADEDSVTTIYVSDQPHLLQTLSGYLVHDCSPAGRVARASAQELPVGPMGREGLPHKDTMTADSIDVVARNAIAEEEDEDFLLVDPRRSQQVQHSIERRNVVAMAPGGGHRGADRRDQILVDLVPVQDYRWGGGHVNEGDDMLLLKRLLPPKLLHPRLDMIADKAVVHCLDPRVISWHVALPHRPAVVDNDDGVDSC
mmetsp:Transcript_25837/g.58201  ORF Transcript_25837/g.58201 Transcript_25837/m.58201 type:complete len:479 (+) Transcript_25837:604-2040(+)|eukprot:689687-Hanusia_phi.AAC.2